MRLALSSRLWESADGYAVDQMQHLAIARELGYDGVEMRYPLLPRRPEEIRRIAAALRDLDLTAVFGPCAGVPEDDRSRADASRVMDVLQQLGARWVKCIPMREDQAQGMVQLADMAEARGMILCTQLHAGTLTDTVERTEDFLRDVDHPSLGLIFDAAHLQLAGDPDLEGALQRLGPWLELVNVQCLSRDPASGTWVPALPDATDLAPLLRALPSPRPWLTVMPACVAGQDPMAVARTYRQALSACVRPSQGV